MIEMESNRGEGVTISPLLDWRYYIFENMNETKAGNGVELLKKDKISEIHSVKEMGTGKSDGGRKSVGWEA